MEEQFQSKQAKVDHFKKLSNDFFAEEIMIKHERERLMMADRQSLKTQEKRKKEYQKELIV